MRMLTIKALTFKELSKEAQQKVLEKYRTWNVEDDCWYDCAFDEWKEKLAKKGFENAEIHFSGFWSQGDGACFDANINAKKAAHALGFNKAELLAIEIADPHYTIETVNHHYSHANTRDVQYGECYNMSGIELDELEKIMNTPVKDLPLLIGTVNDSQVQDFFAYRLKSGLEIRFNLFEKLEESLEEFRKNISNEIYRKLEKEYSFLTSDKQVIESLEDNDMEFDEDGNKI